MITFKLTDADAAFVLSKISNLDPTPALAIDLQSQFNTQQVAPAPAAPAPIPKMEKVTTTTTTVVEEVIPTPAA